MANKKYTFIDLFAGCGGLSEGFMESGYFRGLAHIEWELPMVRTLRNRLVKKWHESDEQAQNRVILFDIQRTDELLNGNWTQESKDMYEKYNSLEAQKGLRQLINGETVDLIIGGPPCQAYSIHGRATDKNSMQDDYRNYLFESFVKVVDNIKPKAFIFENVTGMLSAKPGGKPVVERIYKAVSEREENIKTNDDAPIAVDVDENGNSIDYTKYSFDGKSRLSKKDLGHNIVMKYINEHSDKTFAELQSDLAFDDTVDNKYRYKGVLARAEEITGSYTSCFGAEQTSSDGVKYKVLTWWNKYNIDFIIKFAKAQGWAVNTVTE